VERGLAAPYDELGKLLAEETEEWDNLIRFAGIETE
jgi:hypothetical protein